MNERRNNLYISDILSRAFSLCKENFIEVIKAAGVFILPVIIIQLVFTKMMLTDITNVFLNPEIYSNSYYMESTINNTNLGTTILGFLLYLVIIVLSLFGYLVITKILDYANKGEDVNWITATKYVWKKKWSLLGLNILVYIMFIVAVIAFMLLSFLIALITLGIGFIIIIPLYLALFIIAIPLMYAFNSVMLVKDLGITDSIRETFLLFRKGYFWSTVGKFSAISGIMVGLSIAIIIINLIISVLTPIIGFILLMLTSYIIGLYFIAYLNVFVLDRTKTDIDNFGNNNIDDNFIDPII